MGFGDLIQTAAAVYQAGKAQTEAPPDTKAWSESAGVTGGIQSAGAGALVAVASIAGVAIDGGSLMALITALGGVWSAVQGLRAAWGRVQATTAIRR